MAKFDKTSPIVEILQKCPDATGILARNGLNCCECMGADIETLEDGALMHGLDVEILLNDLNSSCPLEDTKEQ